MNLVHPWALGLEASEFALAQKGGGKATSEVTRALRTPLCPEEEKAKRKNQFHQMSQKHSACTPFVIDGFDMTPNDTCLLQLRPCAIPNGPNLATCSNG